jgi:hypothetical protein
VAIVRETGDKCNISMVTVLFYQPQLGQYAKQTWMNVIALHHNQDILQISLNYMGKDECRKQ